MALRLGFEKVILKNGLMILHFVYNQSSPYYKTGLFAGILKYVTSRPAKFLFKQHNNRLQLTVRTIGNSGQALEALAELAREAERSSAGGNGVRA